MKKQIDFTKNLFNKFVKATKKESKETKEMLITYSQLLHDQLGGNNNPSPKLIKEAHEQLGDLGKLSLLAPILILPGSFITIPLLIKLGKRYGVNIIPS